MRQATGLILILVLGGSRAAAARELGVLLVPADNALAAELGRELTARLGTRELVVVEAERLTARLARAPHVARSLEAAAAAVNASERHWLYLRRSPALTEARRAVDSLAAIAGRHHARPLLARAEAATALAQLLQPADEAAALQSFCAALDADPSFRARGGRLASRASRLWEVALARPRRAAGPPARDELETLASLAGVPVLVWVAPGPAGGRTRLVVYDRTRRRRAEDSVSCSGCALGATLAGRVVALLPRPSPRVGSGPTHLAALPQSTPAAAPRVAPPRPPPAAGRSSPRWYRRWWIWTLAGAVLVGVGATVAAVELSRPERSYQLRVHY